MVYTYHSFLVHSSADGHLGCFHVLAMTNSSAMNIGVHVSLSDLSRPLLSEAYLPWSQRYSFTSLTDFSIISLSFSIFFFSFGCDSVMTLGTTAMKQTLKKSKSETAFRNLFF